MIVTTSLLLCLMLTDPAMPGGVASASFVHAESSCFDSVGTASGKSERPTSERVPLLATSWKRDGSVRREHFTNGGFSTVLGIGVALLIFWVRRSK